MASDDVRALARDILSGLKRYGDKGLRLQMEALARAVLAQETRPTCATCRWWRLAPGAALGLCGVARGDAAVTAVSAATGAFHHGSACTADWYCADHQPARPDQPREEKA